MKPTHFLWIDLEMTGLKPEEDLITEVAVIITDSLLNEIAVYQSGVRHPEKKLRKLINLNPWYRERPEHSEKIISESISGKPEKIVQTEVLELIQKHVGLSKAVQDFPFIPGSLEIKGEIYMAGNSIMSDRMFIESYWTDLARVLHYRMLDVSAFKLWYQSQGKSEFKKNSTHRAIDDVRESIAELKYYIGSD